MLWYFFFGWYASNSSFQNRIFWNQVVYVVYNNKLQYPSSLLHGELTDHYTRSEFSDFWNFVKKNRSWKIWVDGWVTAKGVVCCMQRRIHRRLTAGARPCLKNFKGVIFAKFDSITRINYMYVVFYSHYKSMGYVWRGIKKNLQTSKIIPRRDRVPRFLNSWIRHWHGHIPGTCQNRAREVRGIGWQPYVLLKTRFSHAKYIKLKTKISPKFLSRRHSNT